MAENKNPIAEEPEVTKKEPTAAELMAAEIALLRKEIAEAKEAQQKPSEPPIKPPAVDPYWEEYVPVELFYDGDKYKDDVTVAVNGDVCIIQRGKPVKIKRKFAYALKKSHKQDALAADYINGKTAEYEKNKVVLT